MSKKLPWNYNMDEAPTNGMDVLVSDGTAIWIAYNTINVWHCNEGLLYIKFIAWCEIDLPEREHSV